MNTPRSFLDEITSKMVSDYADKASDAQRHRKLSTSKLDQRYKSMALAQRKMSGKANVPTTEGRTMKSLIQFMEQLTLQEAHDIELKPHENGTHFIVHKIHPRSGIESDQLKKGEKISDSHVDDLHDMGYTVKIHSSK